MLTYSFENIGAESLYEHLYRCIRADILAGRLHKPAQTAKKKSPAFAEPFPTKIIFIRQSFWETGKLFKGRWWRHRAPFLCLYYMPPGGRIPPF